MNSGVAPPSARFLAFKAVVKNQLSVLHVASLSNLALQTDRFTAPAELNVDSGSDPSFLTFYAEEDRAVADRFARRADRCRRARTVPAF